MIERRTIKAVLFDVDGTLYAQLPLRAAMACELAWAQMQPVRRQPVQALRILRTFRRMREQLREQNGTTPLESEQYRVVSRQLGCSEQDVRITVDEWMYRRPLKYLRLVRRPGVLQLLDTLRAKRVGRGVFSDYPVKEKLAALGVSDKFDVCVSAVDPEVGAFKPSPRGFTRACEMWGLGPGEVLYVGDRVEVDGAGATAAGMRYAVLGRRSTSSHEGWIVRDFAELERVICAHC